MTYRVVPLRSADASDAALGTTGAQRLGMVFELSLMAWAAGGRVLPVYTRADMPIRLSRLSDQGGPEEKALISFGAPVVDLAIGVEDFVRADVVAQIGLRRIASICSPRSVASISTRRGQSVPKARSQECWCRSLAGGHSC